MNLDEALRDLERRAADGDSEAQDSLLDAYERRGGTGLQQLVSMIQEANAECPRGPVTESALRDFLLRLGRQNAAVAWVTGRTDFRSRRRRGQPLSWVEEGAPDASENVVIVLGVGDVTHRGEHVVLLAVGTTPDVRQQPVRPEASWVVSPAAVWPELGRMDLARITYVDRGTRTLAVPCTTTYVQPANPAIQRDPAQREPYYTTLSRFLELARGGFARGTPASAGFVVMRKIHVDDAGAGPHGAGIEGLL